MSEPRLDSVASPERALALVVATTMDLDDALARAPGWERWVYKLTVSEGTSDLVQAIAWYRELAEYSEDLRVEAQLAVLEGEAGRLDRVRERAEVWERAGPPRAAWAPVLRVAYVEVPPDVASRAEIGDALAEALPAGWFRERLAGRLLARAGDRTGLAALRSVREERLAPLLPRIRRFALGQLVLLLAGLLALGVWLARIRRAPGAVTGGAAALPPPWGGSAGVVVLIRGSALAAVLIAALDLVPGLVGTHHPVLDVLEVPVAALPLILLARWHLLAPAGQGLARGLGLVSEPGCSGRLALATLALVAIGILGDLALGLAGDWLGFGGHWTEWFDADLAWGSPLEVAGSVVSAVVAAPVVEEIAFRGLLYATLRRRLSWVLAAGISAAVFALLHGYGVSGFASVFGSGVLWAWAYERTRSLLPGIVAHAANNLLAALTVLWFLHV